MKRAIVIFVAIASLIAAFLAGAAVSMHYIAVPFVSQQQLLQKEFYLNQVLALRHLSEGDPQLAQTVLRGLNVYDLIYLVGDKSAEQDPALRKAMEYTCEDAVGYMKEDKKYTELMRAEVEKACQEFQARREPLEKS